MGLGYERPLFLLALDHRAPPHDAVFGVSVPPTPADVARIRAAKALIVDGFAMAVGAGAPIEGAGILVDERFGAALAHRALAAGWVVAMPAERSGVSPFELEHGEDFGAHIEAFDPTFTKALVRYNPSGTPSDNAASITRLQHLSGWLLGSGRKLMLELIVRPEPAQLDAVGGDTGRFERETRPGLMRESIATFQAAGIEADVWKIEGIDDRGDAELVTAQARAGGRDAVGCVVLGQGAGPERVARWLRTAAGVPGYLGFAIGRTIWSEPVNGFLDGSLPRDDAARQIAQRYRRAVREYLDAA